MEHGTTDAELAAGSVMAQNWLTVQSATAEISNSRQWLQP